MKKYSFLTVLALLIIISTIVLMIIFPSFDVIVLTVPFLLLSIGLFIISLFDYKYLDNDKIKIINIA